MWRTQKASLSSFKYPFHWLTHFLFSTRKRNRVRENSIVFATAIHKNLKISGTRNKNWTLSPVQFSYSNLSNKAQPQPTGPAYYSGFHLGHNISIFKRSHSQSWEAACCLIRTLSNKNLSSGRVRFLREQLAEGSLGRVVSAILTLRGSAIFPQSDVAQQPHGNLINFFGDVLVNS